MVWKGKSVFNVWSLMSSAGKCHGEGFMKSKKSSSEGLGKIEYAFLPWLLGEYSFTHQPFLNIIWHCRISCFTFVPLSGCRPKYSVLIDDFKLLTITVSQCHTLSVHVWPPVCVQCLTSGYGVNRSTLCSIDKQAGKINSRHPLSKC